MNESVRVYYPSGNNTTIKAKLVKIGPMTTTATGETETFGVLFEVTDLTRLFHQKAQRGEMLLLDPRAVCVDEATGQIIYNGRDHYAQLPADMQEYLDKHPEWPSILELSKQT